MTDPARRPPDAGDRRRPGFRLVIVTGNAGDGKTSAIVQREVEQYFRDGLGVADIEPPPHAATGAAGCMASSRYETNYDGSQDEADVENDAVLSRFFAPFSGPQLSGLDGDQARLIAVNEGRLLDFLEHGASGAEFGGLRRFVKESLDGAEPPDGSLYWSTLNLRAVTAGGRVVAGRERQLETALLKLVELWRRPCDHCEC